MKKKLLKINTLCAFLVASLTISGQVTFGSGIRPVEGALLQLKEQDVPNGEANASRGLGFPRVTLVKEDMLFPMFDDNGSNGYIGATKASEDKHHIGLLVFNISEISPFCKGLYSWNGEKWLRMNQNPCTGPGTSMSLSVSPAGPLYFASGLNGTTITGKQVTLVWTPSCSANYTIGTHGGFGLTNCAFAPATPWTNNTGEVVTITPDAMTPLQVSSNPFLTKESEVTFTITDQGTTKSEKLVVNQTNKALKANGSLTSPAAKMIITSSLVQNFNIESNAVWRASKSDPNAALTAITASGGVELNNGTAQTTLFSYTPANTSTSKYADVSVTFADNTTPARFSPITINMLSCVGTGVAPANASKQATVTFNPNTAVIDIPSGSDLRGTSTALNYTVNWTGSSMEIKPVQQTGGSLSTGMFTTSPWGASGSTQTSTTKPLTYTASANRLNAPSATTPWASREWKVTYKALDDCGGTEKVLTVNQTNYGMTVNGSSTPTVIEDPTAGTGKTATIRTNANWKLAEIVPGSQSAFYGVNITEGTSQGSDKKDGTINQQNVSYSIRTGANVSRYSSLVFSDYKSPKRFNDVTLSIVQCSNAGINPSMAQWAAMAGFDNVPATKVTDADDIAKGIDRPDPTTGIAWHRDQSGNIFLSANFDATNPTGNNERWMITNLAATTYAPGLNHTSLRSLSGPVYTAIYYEPQWGYPNKDATLKTNNPRMGLLYNWDAATAGKGGYGGQGNITNESGNNSYARVQGICPNNWHLPSDYEWTVLENQIIYRTATYSSTPNIDGTNANSIPQGGTSSTRGTLLGKAMKEVCEPYTETAYKGTSNPVSTTFRGGFDALFAGSADNNMVHSYGTSGLFWSSSSTSSTNAWYRAVGDDSSKVSRNNDFRFHMLSVRCKKN